VLRQVTALASTSRGTISLLSAWRAGWRKLRASPLTKMTP
jgi:hypothetical protein